MSLHKSSDLEYRLNKERIMRQHRWLVTMAVTVVAAGLAVAEGETVGVSGSDARFPTRTEVTVGYRPVRLVLTGTAVRKSHGLDVYAVASYVQEGTRAQTA